MQTGKQLIEKTIPVVMNSRKNIDNPAQFDVAFSPSMFLDPTCDWSIALQSCSVWYTFPNISAKLGSKFRFWYEMWIEIVFPDGQYLIEDINAEIARQLRGYYPADPNLFFFTNSDNESQCRVYFTENTVTGKFVLNINQIYPEKVAPDPQVITVDFTDPTTEYANVRDILGFNKGHYSAPSTEAHQLANIERDINTLNICLPGIVASSYFNGNGNSSVIHSHPISTGLRHLISIAPNNLVYCELNKFSLSEVRIEVRDNLNRVVPLVDETSFSFILRKRQYI